ncbi:MAG: hypothetical protein IJF29_03880 [Firmicutes bacterium]|nr:hypothetical protein [Bacillota bacterium]
MKNKLLKLCSVMVFLVIFASGCGGNSETKETTSATIPAKQTSEGSTSVSDIIESKTRPLAVGKIENGIYTNEYLGIGCNIPSTWTSYISSSLSDLKLDSNAYTDLDAEYMDPNNRYYEFTTIQYVPCVDENENPLLITEEDMFNTVTEEYMKSLANSYGFIPERNTITNVTFLGESHKAIYMEGNIDPEVYGYEWPFYFIQLLNFELGQFGVAHTFVSMNENKTEELLSMFYKLGEENNPSIEPTTYPTSVLGSIENNI